MKANTEFFALFSAFRKGKGYTQLTLTLNPSRVYTTVALTLIPTLILTLILTLTLNPNPKAKPLP